MSTRPARHVLRGAPLRDAMPEQLGRAIFVHAWLLGIAFAGSYAAIGSSASGRPAASNAAVATST